MNVFLFLMLFLIACIPCYASYRLRDYQLLAVTVVCALLSFLFLPFILSVMLVNRKLPKTKTPPVSFGFFAGYWGLLLLLFLILPFMSAFGLSVNGYQFFQLSSLSDQASIQVVFFLIAVILSFILSLLLRQRALYTGELILFLAAYSAFAILAFNLIHYEIASYGTYLMVFLYATGIVGLYAVTASMFQAAKEEPASLPEPLEELGSETISVLSGTVEKIGSAVKARLSEMKKPTPLIIHCIHGVYAGAEFSLPADGKITLGSDPSQANLIFSSREISRLHCTIFFSGQSGTVQILDSSTNGTFCPDGKRLPKDQLAELPLPCTIYFGNEPEIFEIRKGLS